MHCPYFGVHWCYEQWTHWKSSKSQGRFAIMRQCWCMIFALCQKLDFGMSLSHNFFTLIFAIYLFSLSSHGHFTKDHYFLLLVSLCKLAWSNIPFPRGPLWILIALLVGWQKHLFFEPGYPKLAASPLCAISSFKCWIVLWRNIDVFGFLVYHNGFGRTYCLVPTFFCQPRKMPY